MAFPLFPLLLAGGVTYVSHSWLTKNSIESADYIPRFWEGGSDARLWLIGAGVAGVLFGPVVPMIGAAAIGAGVGGAISYDTTSRVKTAVSRYLEQQPPGLLEERGLVEQLTTLLEEAPAER
jgi:hypothetical protein